MDKQNKVSTKMLRSMAVGDTKTLLGQTYKSCCSASALARQTSLRYGIETKVTYRERVDGTYELTVKRMS